MASPTAIVAYLALFTLTGFLFLFVNLLVGYLVRPKLPNKEKLEVYECGEPVIGSSFVQFDLRFYVVALLFIIFDVEVAFFFPWATVFGKATQITAVEAPLIAEESLQLSDVAAARYFELGITRPELQTVLNEETVAQAGASGAADRLEAAMRSSAGQLAWTSLADIGVFFAVLMVGFAYVWKRGDLDWVRAVTQEKRERFPHDPTPRPLEPSSSILSA